MTQRRLSSRGLAVLLAMLLVPASFIDPPIALAAPGNGACQSAYVNSHASGSRHAPATGAEATIDSLAPLLCTTSAADGLNGSFSYVSIEVSTSSRNIIQIGYAKCVYPSYSICNGNYRLFYAWGRQKFYAGGCTTDAYPIPINLGAAPAGVHEFTIYKTGQYVVMNMDGQTPPLVKIPIGAVNCWNATDMTVAGETWDRGDQMGGLVGTHQVFKDVLYQQTVGGQWFSPSFTGCRSDIPGIYICSRVNGQRIDIWTDRS